MRGPVTKTCGQCKQTFECGQYGCWCGQMGVTERQLDWISARFEDCLCPTCLKQVVSSELGSPVTPSAL